MRTVRAAVLALCLACVLGACGAGPDSESQLLHSARTAYITGENLSAEDLYQKYLQDYPEGAYRLEAWNRLYDIAVNLRGDKRGAVLLVDAMLMEYAADPALIPELISRAAQLHGDLHDYEKAGTFWTQYIGLPQVPQPRRNQARLRLAKVYAVQKRIEDSLRILRECQQVKDEEQVYASCQLEEAGGLIRLERHDAAKALLLDLRSKVPAGSAVWNQAGFLLGEIYEQAHQTAQAIEVYESLLDTFPNPQAVRTRIQNLKK
jgi:tetratricopeptide (TPR) repeat protein